MKYNQPKLNFVSSKPQKDVINTNSSTTNNSSNVIFIVFLGFDYFSSITFFSMFCQCSVNRTSCTVTNT